MTTATDLMRFGCSLARQAAAAYAAQPDECLEAIEHAATDTRAVLCRLPEEGLVVAFRGTRSLANFVTDLSCRRAPLFAGADAEVHHGFKAALDGIWPDLHDAVLSLRVAGEDLWFTGHSLGGALAKLAALRFASPQTFICTFGEPRVGNAAFRDFYNRQMLDRTWRVVHGDDVVPRLPGLLSGYRHSGHEVFYPSYGSAPALDRPAWRYAVSDLAAAVRVALRPLSVGQLLADHHVNNYLRLFQPSTFSLQPSSP